MTDELYNFANDQNNKNYDKFIKAGFHWIDFIEASICMVLKCGFALEVCSLDPILSIVGKCSYKNREDGKDV